MWSCLIAVHGQLLNKMCDRSQHEHKKKCFVNILVIDMSQILEIIIGDRSDFTVVGH